MFDSSRNETQIQQKMHFHKTVQDLPIYNIHKNFEFLDVSKLSVENIIDTVFFNCEDKKHAQICAQTYICHRIIKKATELKLTAIFYQDPFERSKTLYEEPIYILVKNEIGSIAKRALSHPIRLLLNRCSKTKRSAKKNQKEKTRKQKRWKTLKSSVMDESLHSIVGKFPNLIIPKLSAKEISYYMKPKQRSFELETSKRRNLRKRKVKSNSCKINKENIPKNAEVRRSSRLSEKKKAKSTVKTNFQEKLDFSFETYSLENHVETNFQKEKRLSAISETVLPADYNKTSFLDDKNLSISGTYLLDNYQHNDLASTENYFQKDNALGKANSHLCVFDKQNVEGTRNMCEILFDVQNADRDSNTCESGYNEQDFGENSKISELVYDDQDFEENNKVSESVYDEQEVEENSYSSKFVNDEQVIEKNSSSNELFVIENQDLQENNSSCELFVNEMQDLEENNSSCEFINNEQDVEVNSKSCEIVNDEQNFEENSNTCEYMKSTCLDANTNLDEQLESMIRLEREKGYTSSGYLCGDCTLEHVVKTRLNVTGDTCRHLKDFGFDKRVVESLQELYKSVHAGKNNYVFCEFIY